MAAYAALVSLMNILEQIKNHPRFFASFDKYQIGYLGETIHFFLDFVESYNDSVRGINREAEELESRIASAAHEAEDVIEPYIVNQILPGLILDVRLQHRCLFSLQKVIQDMDETMNDVLKFKEGRGFDFQKVANSTPAASSTTVNKSSMVGFDDELMQVKDVLTGRQSSRQVISIVGMGGTGKTTLAKYVYEDSLTLHHFDMRAWATISHECNVRDILLQLLSCTSGTVDELGEQLHKSLFGRRYLIILDDMWSTEVWDSIKFFFPDNGNGSRVVLTTRLSNLCSFCIRINFLDEHKSWDLFCIKTFGQEDCPPELVGIGKKIVEQCRGLPLSVVVIGGLLRKSSKSKEYWQYVEKNINSILTSRESGRCLDVLYLSYSHLPAYLKPCFLYIGTFKEDYEIRVSEIIKLWIAEGFLKPNGVKILEEIAEDYLKDLTERNLISICAHRSNGKIKSYRIHDLLRELCIRVADKEKFFRVMTTHSIPRDVDRERRLIFHGTTSRNINVEVFKALQSSSVARSFICDAAEAPVNCRLMRVSNKAFHWCIETKFQNVNLRYVSCLRSVLPSSISRIWNLQTLIIDGGNQLSFAPSELWEMSQIRHLKWSRILLPDPPPSSEGEDSVVLKNLQTLKVLVNFRLSEEVCKIIPNIKKLRIVYEDLNFQNDDGLYENLRNLGCFRKLDSLNICCFKKTPMLINVLKNAFPDSLNKLCLGGCKLHWEDLSMIIGSLPHLEVLKLKNPLSEVCEWKCVEGGFLRLKFLSIEYGKLKCWTLENTSYFPVLEKLVLIRMWNLDEIPLGIGEITTLQLIRLEYCTESAAISATKIKEEQESFGIYDLQIQVRMTPQKAERFRKSVKKIEGLSIN